MGREKTAINSVPDSPETSLEGQMFRDWRDGHMADGKEDDRGSHSRKERGCPLSYLNHTHFRNTNLIYTQVGLW